LVWTNPVGIIEYVLWVNIYNYRYTSRTILSLFNSNLFTAVYVNFIYRIFPRGVIKMERTRMKYWILTVITFILSSFLLKSLIETYPDSKIWFFLLFLLGAICSILIRTLVELNYGESENEK
jgi:predicted membrane channel-forming protein YqfA (hemolysin III family)